MAQQPVNRKKNQRKRQNEAEKLEELAKKLEEFDPSSTSATQFSELPISENTLKGLTSASFVSMTDIQKKSIPIALKGHDVMGAARTGSGKTLAFLIPVIESLIRNKFNEFDGLGALIVSPTRELAIQTFDVLTKIGKYNSFSAGLVIGGKDVKYEMDRVSKMNILVGTPGRLLQHFDQAIGFDTSNLQMLVLDEADRILDMGFKKDIDAILKHVPAARQTLLFSATQFEDLNHLARLSLTNPQKVGEAMSSIPSTLEQSYTTVKLEAKLDVLWSFIKSHLKSKILVFFSSSKQVRFVYESFRTMQPGISLMQLHGKQKQTTRTDTSDKFKNAQHVCLFATDVVARGLDFPDINWVIQVDAPEDSATYVHRVGRAARFGKDGKSLLMVTPSEQEGMLKRLKAANIELNPLNIKQSKIKSIKNQLQALCFQSTQVKYLGQTSFISYFKSVYLQKDKEIFDVKNINLESYAESLGLPSAPKIKIRGADKNKELKNKSRQLLSLSKMNEDGEIDDANSKKVRTKYDRMFERQNQDVLSNHYREIIGANDDQDEDDDDDFMTVKRKDHDLGGEALPDLSIPVSKRAAKRALSKKASAVGNPTKLLFDDEGKAHALYELEDEEDFHKAGDAKAQKEQFVSKEAEFMGQADVEDKEVAKEKRQEKKRKRQEAERRAREESLMSGSDLEPEGYPVVAQLGSDNDVDLDKDLESSEDESHTTKKPKWFQDGRFDKKAHQDSFIEMEEPETLEDLEALSAKLLQG